ncbi:MAG: HD domain-containing phosphohydrolase [Candidatus Omnitrophota bacterium]
MDRRRKEKNILEILLEVSRKTSSSLDMQTVSGIILKHARSFVNADYSALFLLDDESKHLILIGADGFSKNQMDNLNLLRNLEEINAEVVKKRKTLVFTNMAKKIADNKIRLRHAGAKFPLGAFIAVPLNKDNKVVGVLIVSNDKAGKMAFTEQHKKLLYTLANHVSIALLNAKLYKELKDLFLNTVESLASAIDARDRYTHGHSRRVAQYAVAIAEEINKTPDFIGNVRLSGLLHDIGKIGIRDSILSKTGPLTDEEVIKMRAHPTIGLKIVETVINYQGVIRGIVEHHERLNGSGYPNKLYNDGISLEGRIIAVADTFDALTTTRPYQAPYTAKEAMLEIVRCSGDLFDPCVVKAFQTSFSKYPRILEIYLKYVRRAYGFFVAKKNVSRADGNFPHFARNPCHIY